MLKLIEDFPNHIIEGKNIANASSLTKPKDEIRNVVLCGMGGSGIGAKIVSDVLLQEARCSITTVNDYFLPAFVSKNTLVVASSYSGNTEETLQCLEEAAKKGAKIVCICSGGKMHQFCEQNDHNVIIVPGGRPPRSALAYSMVQIMHVLFFNKIIASDKSKELQESINLLRSEISQIKMEAQKLSKFLYKKVGVFYSETKFDGVLVRARQQVNENSKFLAWHHVIPEMNHNELVGWGGGDTRFAPVFFETEDVYKRNLTRLKISKSAIKKMAEQIHVVKSKGNSLLSKTMYFIHLIDWTSYYLCELNKADILDISIIDHLKSELSKLK